MDPETVPVQGHSVVRVAAPGTIDGESRQVGQIQAFLIRREAGGNRGGTQGKAEARRVGVYRRGPGPAVQQEPVGFFGCLGAAQILEGAALFGPTVGQGLHVLQEAAFRLAKRRGLKWRRTGYGIRRMRTGRSFLRRGIRYSIRRMRTWCGRFLPEPFQKGFPFPEFSRFF
jgi:hypothetical protein